VNLHDGLILEYPSKTATEITTLTFSKLSLYIVIWDYNGSGYPV